MRAGPKYQLSADIHSHKKYNWRYLFFAFSKGDPIIKELTFHGIVKPTFGCLGKRNGRVSWRKLIKNPQWSPIQASRQHFVFVTGGQAVILTGSPNVTCDIWHLRCDICYVTHDMGHVTHDTYSYVLGEAVFWRYFLQIMTNSLREAILKTSQDCKKLPWTHHVDVEVSSCLFLLKYFTLTITVTITTITISFFFSFVTI